MHALGAKRAKLTFMASSQQANPAVDLLFQPATEMARLIRERKLSPVELVNAHLARIEQLNPKLNAIVCLAADQAREQAKRAEALAARGEFVGPLHGVPITIKSSIEVAGMLCETGSPLNQGHRPKTDAALVRRLKDAGAIILGTTNCPEFLMAYETDNALHGRTNSPWALDRTPGGSSGGEAAAIASGMSTAGFGSDSGGSVREPAHFSGICALKPTPGRIPGTGHVPCCVGPFDRLGAVGPMTRTVADLKQMFAVTAGYDAGDPVSAPVPLRHVSSEELKRVRIGYFEDDDRTPVTPETRGALRQARESLVGQGFEVVEFRPEGLEVSRELWWKFFSICGAMILGPIVKDHSRMSPMLREFMKRMDPDVPLCGQDLLDAWIQMDNVRGNVLAQMQQFPILLCPVCAIPAFKHGERNWQVEGKTIEYFDIFSYTQFFNVLGMPAAVVPIARTSEGLPIGVQVVGMPWEEEVVLEVSERVERDFGFCPPDLSKLI